MNFILDIICVRSFICNEILLLEASVFGNNNVSDKRITVFCAGQAGAIITQLLFYEFAWYSVLWSILLDIRKPCKKQIILSEKLSIFETHKSL